MTKRNGTHIKIGHLDFNFVNPVTAEFLPGQPQEHEVIREAVDRLVGRLLLEHSKPKRVHHREIMEIAQSAEQALRRDSDVPVDDKVTADELQRRACCTALAVIQAPEQHQMYERAVMAEASGIRR